MLGGIGYTVVQHAGYVRGGDPQLCRGLQAVRLRTDSQRAVVERVGGRVFRRLGPAETWAQGQAYPIGYTGLQPVAQGNFALESIDGLPIYIPPDE